MPDLEEMCKEYLLQRSTGNHEKADFLVIEMLDQCVRRERGGELGMYYKKLLSRKDQAAQEMQNYISERTGKGRDNVKSGKSDETIGSKIKHRFSKNYSSLEKKYHKAISYLFLPAFRQQNIVFTSIGERHMWIYDYFSMVRLLEKAGFVDIRRLAYNNSDIAQFPLIPLDMTQEGQPRKGLESMYIEATRKK